MSPSTVIALAFAATMALAGFLLFQVQLVLAKFILPWFGGSASTWLVCMLFFQVALLAGYAYAYAVTRPLAVPRQAGLQIALLALSVLALPIAPSEAWKPQDAGDPTGRILGLLAVSVGLPYVVLATTTPLASRWLALIAPGLDPVRFFAASNAGSFLGLLTYPFVFERVLSSPAQTRWWSWAFVVYALLFAACAVLTLRGAPDRDRRAEPAVAAPGKAPIGAWLGYAMLGSVLLLATTNAMTQWSAVVPFLWVLPLSLYLLTFVVVFAHARAYHRTAWGIAFPLLAAAALTMQGAPLTTLALASQLALHAATLFAGCMICHGELMRLQPEPARLPSFYLAIAAGGALGGIAVVIAAPLLLGDYFEHPLVLAAIGVLALARLLPSPRRLEWRTAAAAVAGLCLLTGFGISLREEAGGGALIERVRNFYGVVKVARREEANDTRLALLLGGADQGGQWQSPERRHQPACGFDVEHGLALALAHHARRRKDGPDTPLRIGVVGLGVGMAATLGRPGDTLTYYEINPAVADLAQRHFTFLRESRARVEVKLGDGRLVLERELKAGQRQEFDVLVLDAFRGASPPMHLMTREAFDIYLGHLAPDGILAVNFELDTFEVAPLHRGLARVFGLDVAWFESWADDGSCDLSISWALYTKDRRFLRSPLVRAARTRWRDRSKSELVWTDNASNLMSIVVWRRD